MPLSKSSITSVTIGHRRNGEPIYLIAGGSGDAGITIPVPNSGPAPTAQPDASNPPAPAEPSGPAAQTLPAPETPPAAETPPAQQQAPEGDPNPPPLTNEQIEAIRAEERAKLHTRLSRVDEIENELAQYRREREEARQREEAEAAAAAQAQRQAEREDLDPKFAEALSKVEQDFEAKLREERELRERQEAIFNKEREIATLEAYRASEIETHKEDIAPQFFPHIKGSTQEEIDQSIQLAIQGTSEIMQEVMSAQQQQRQQQRGVSPTSGSTGPLEAQAATRTLTAEDIAAMNPAEYAQHRQALLAEASKKGLYG